MSVRIISDVTINRLASFGATVDGALPQGLSPSSFAMALRSANDAAFKRRYPQNPERQDSFSFDWLPLVPPHAVLIALEEYLYNGGDEIDTETLSILQRIRAEALKMTREIND